MSKVEAESRSARRIRLWQALAFATLLANLGLVWAQDKAALPSFKKLDTMEARVQGCVTCHGQHGQGTNNGYFPRIAGKPAGYIYNQLIAFRNGTRHYPPMNYLVAYLPDAYLKEVAEYYSKKNPPYTVRAKAAPAEVEVHRGEQLVMKGDSAKTIPACIACHGQSLTGMEPGIPGLSGLNPTYVVGQLTRWRVGERKAADPDCMKRIASRMSDTDIAAVASWLATQAPPVKTAPEPSNLVRMPLACGSQK